MKLFTVTVSAYNSCYTQTLMVMALEKDRVKDIVIEWRKKEHGTSFVGFLNEVKQVPILIVESMERVVEVWFGHAEDKNVNYD